jgi:hypothetical protein
MCVERRTYVHIATRSLYFSSVGYYGFGYGFGKGVGMGDRLSVIAKVRGVEGTRMSAGARSMSTAPGVIRKGE